MCYCHPKKQITSIKIAAIIVSRQKIPENSEKGLKKFILIKMQSKWKESSDVIKWNWKQFVSDTLCV